MNRQIGNWYYYSGVIHIHTTESDGTRPLEEVVALGREAGVDFMMFSDHMNLRNRENGKEGFYGDTLVVVGYEHNDKDDNHHYLIFGSETTYPSNLKAAEYVDRAAKDGALGIIAHPDELKKRTRPHRSYPWLDWSVNGFQALELWNHMSEWMDKLTPANKLIMAFSPRKSMVGPREMTLKRWDDLNMSRKVAGIASPDAHAFKVRAWPLTVRIFPYKVHFKTLRTHIILPEAMSSDLDTAKNQVFDAIRDCRLYFSNMRWGLADGFEFYADNGKQEAVAGGAVAFNDNTVLKIKLPDTADIKIVGNGTKIFEGAESSMEYQVKDPGIYRVEAWKNGHGWIFSNHVRVSDRS